MIEIRGLKKVYADGHVTLRGIDLDVGDGMLGLLGPNGAGKTTFLSLLVLAREPSAGSRIYDGLDAARSGNRAAIRKMIGYLPQDFEPIRHLTGFEYLVHCARLRGVGMRLREIERRARELLDAVFLTHAANRRSGEYSGGMRRRLGIAQALIHSPSLIVVDEPTAGLDPEERIRFRNLITDAADETAVLLSTHIVEDIEATCPRIAVIAAGGLLFDGPPSDLLERVVGKLWEIPAASEVPPESVPVARRLSETGEPLVVVYSQRPPGGARAREATLEEAYSSFLALHAMNESSSAAADSSP